MIQLINYGAENMPTRAHPDDFGLDVYATETVTINPGRCHKFGLGFGVVVPKGYAGYIEPRGSTGLRGLLPVSNPIDCGYTGQVHCVIWNITREQQRIEYGDRIAQLVIKQGIVETVVIVEPEDVPETARGSGNHGSTGRG